MSLIFKKEMFYRFESRREGKNIFLGVLHSILPRNETVDHSDVTRTLRMAVPPMSNNERTCVSESGKEE